MVKGEASTDAVDLAEVFGGRYIRSPVYDWLDLNFDEIMRLHAGGRRPIAWQPVAEHLARIKVLDGSGKPPTPRLLAKVWVRVKASRKANLLAEPKASEDPAPQIGVASSREPPAYLGAAGRPSAAGRRRSTPQESAQEVSDEAALQHLADVLDSLETNGGLGKPKNPYREQLDAMRAAKTTAPTSKKNSPT